MSKILLFFPKLEEYKDYHHLPITALAVASELLARGNEVVIHDERVDDSSTLIKKINNANEIMVSAFTGYQLTRAYEFIKLVKQNTNKKITIGGPHATALPQQTLESKYIDEVFIGEFDSGENLLPYHLLDIEKYINPATKRFIYVTSYGCVGVCTFCATKNKRKLKFLELDKVEQDIDNLMKIYPFEQAVFFDATAFTIKERAHRIAKIMNKHNLKWIADARAPEIARLDDGILKDIIDSGLMQLTIGLESGSERVVKLMKKGKYHLRDYKLAAEKLKKYNMTMASGVIFGTPGETLDDIRQSIQYIKEIKQINPNFRISTTFFKPLPDTILTDLAKEYGHKEPKSLEEWVNQGSGSHYNYNHWNDVPWIDNHNEYKAIYDEFRETNKELFI
ncbi:MAG: B12-binding domain-containing radical SAM protein [Promethearchaeota archaeon]